MRFRCETFRIASMVCGSSARTPVTRSAKTSRISSVFGGTGMRVRAPVACSAQLHQFTGRSAAEACPESPPPCSWIWKRGESRSASPLVWNSLRSERFRTRSCGMFGTASGRLLVLHLPCFLTVMCFVRCSCALNPLFSRCTSLLFSV